MRIRGVAVLAHDDTLDVVAREVRIQLAQFLLRKLIPTDPVIAAQAPRQTLLLPAGERAIDEQVTPALHQVLCAGVADERRQCFDPLGKERPQRTRLLRDPSLAASGDETRQPRHQGRQIAPADDERAHRISQPTWHGANRARHRHRHHRGAVEASRISERCAFARRVGVEHDDIMPLAQQEACRRHTHHAGTDHGHRLLAGPGHDCPLPSAPSNKQIVWIATGKIKSVRATLRRYRQIEVQAMGELRITGVAVDVVRWPLKMKRRHGVGDIEESMPGAIVKISTNADLVGWGEASPWSVFTGTAEANATGIHRYLRPLLIGADPLKISTLMRQIEKTLVGHTEAKAAIEIALLDV